MKQSFKHFFLLILVAVTVSCNKTESYSDEMDAELSFKISTLAGDGNAESMTDDALTRGQRYNSETDFAGQSFGLYAWDATLSNKEVFANVTVSKTDGKWKPSPARHWKKGDSYIFEAVYPQPASTLGSVGLTAFSPNPDPSKLTFSYKVPDATMEDEDKDLMFAYYSGAGTEGVAPITFTHPLTCVNFKAGTMTGVTKINSIKISNVYESGTCTVRTATYDSGSRQCYSYEKDDSENTSLWTPSGTTTVTGTSEIAVEDFLTTAWDYNFLLIPQNTADQNAKIIINLTTESGNNVNLSTTIDSEYWRAGYTNTYKVNIDARLNLVLEISDVVEDNLKNDIQIVNNGDAVCYVRATIVGNWVDMDSNIVSQWTFSEGIFTGLPGANWISRAENGTTVYYYKYPLSPDASIPDELFTSYEAPVCNISGGHLEMEILIQGIEYDDEKNFVTQAWGSDIASQLETLE